MAVGGPLGSLTLYFVEIYVSGSFLAEATARTYTRVEREVGKGRKKKNDRRRNLEERISTPCCASNTTACSFCHDKSWPSHCSEFS